MDPSWLSNAYLVADRAGGTAVFVDSGAPIEPLMAAVERLEVQVTHLLTTHAHPDHIAHHEELERRFGTTVVADPAENVAGAEPVGHGEIIETGDLRIEALRTPGHSPGMLAFSMNGEVCFTGDTLFAGSVGGVRGDTATSFEDLRSSIMEGILELDPACVLNPGHIGHTTVAREWETNPFVRLWRGLDGEGSEPCKALGEPATLILWGDDYDGGYKAWVRWPDGRDDIVPGSRVERG